MKRFGRLLLVLLMVAFSATPTLAQGKEGNLALLYDVDSTNLTYCRFEGQTGDIFDSPVPVNARIKTVGSNVTVSEFTASTNPFAQVNVGDVLIVQTPTAIDPNATTVVAVVTKASAAQITVDTAINLSAAGGFLFSFYKQVCGTTDNDGWATVPSNYSRVSLVTQYDQGDLTALVVRWECKASGPAAAPVIIYPGESSDCGLGGTLATDRCSFATAGITSRIAVNDDSQVFSFCRVGLAYVTADASDATTNREKVTVKIVLR